MRISRAWFWWVSALLLVDFAIFGRSLEFEFVPYDDPAYVTQNGYVNKGLSLEGIRWALWYDDGRQSLQHGGVTNLWHPLTWYSHMVDVSLFGTERALGHHLVNVFLHGLAGVLLMIVSFQLVKNFPAAFTVAMLWMIHPLKAESVSWISERKDLLSGAFFWGSLACALHPSDKNRSFWKSAGWGFFVCALLSKPSVVILPALLILLEGFIREEKSWGWAFWKASLYRYRWWFLTSALVAAITITMQSGGSHSYFIGESSLTQRMIPQALAFGFYLWRFLIPTHLSVDYPTPELEGAILVMAWPVLAILLGAVFHLRKRLPRMFFATAWWCLCLLPVSGLVYVGTSFTSDRYLYLAIAGPLLTFLPTLKKGFEQNNRITRICSLSLAMIWGGLSWNQCGVWQNGWTLFEHATKAQPKSSLGWSNLGGLHQQAGDLQTANKLLRKAVSIESNDHIAWYNLANNQNALGDQINALESFRSSLQCYPDYYPSLKNLGNLLMNNGQIAEAGEFFQKACQVTNFKDPVVIWRYCEAELAQGHFDSAKNLLNRLEALPLQDPTIRSGIQRARIFLQQVE